MKLRKSAIHVSVICKILLFLLPGLNGFLESMLVCHAVKRKYNCYRYPCKLLLSELNFLITQIN